MSNIDISQAVSSMVACHECDLLHFKKKLQDGEIARCTRCGSALYLRKRNSIAKTIAFSITGLIFFFIACFYPLITLKTIVGYNSNTLVTGAIAYYQLGFPSLAIMVVLASVLIPLIKLLVLLYIFIPLSLDRTPWFLAPVFRFYKTIDCWGMPEVYTLTILVVIKSIPDDISGYINIYLTVREGLWAFMGFLLATLSASLALDPYVIWQRLEDDP